MENMEFRIYINKANVKKSVRSRVILKIVAETLKIENKKFQKCYNKGNIQQDMKVKILFRQQCYKIKSPVLKLIH